MSSPFQTFSGDELYPSLIEKASQLCYSLIENHPFVDGNKRIGVHLAFLFLKINKINVIAEQPEIISFGLGIASGNMKKEEIKNWLLKHTK